MQLWYIIKDDIMLARYHLFLVLMKSDIWLLYWN